MRKSLTINGVFYDETGLPELIEQKSGQKELPLWEKEIFEFIREWISEDPTVEVQTSGTTGMPKKYRVRKSAMQVSALKTLEYFGLKKGDNALLCLSPRYIAGKLMIVRAFVGELDLIISEPTSVPLDNLKTEIDFAAMVPMQVQKQLDKDAGAFKHLKKLIIGGGEVPGSLKEKLQKITTEVWETYGMTETLTHIALRKVNGKDKSDWFAILPGVEISKTDDDRLVAKVEGITESELFTNDIVEFKDDKSFMLQGRADDVINTGGIKVMPQLVENKIKERIKRRFVISSLPDETLGEKIVLVIEDENCDENSFELPELQYFEKPKEIICLKEFPETGTGKLKRKEIKNIIRQMENKI
ncbi:MAG: AMP-binding protein [Chlorobi bacterium]|nr:AMP-binding protein [Chlorobiota bacterium]